MQYDVIRCSIWYDDAMVYIITWLWYNIKLGTVKVGDFSWHFNDLICVMLSQITRKSTVEEFVLANNTEFQVLLLHDDVIKWRHFSRYWSFVRRPVTRSFDVFFDLRLNKRSSKQSWGWWFETPSHPLWRHRNGMCRLCARAECPFIVETEPPELANDNCVVTDGIGDCNNDNLRCYQWRQIWYHEDFRVPVSRGCPSLSSDNPLDCRPPGLAIAPARSTNRCRQHVSPIRSYSQGVCISFFVSFYLKGVWEYIIFGLSFSCQVLMCYALQ